MLPAEIYAYAIEKSGAVEDFFTQTIGLDLGKAGAVLKQRGLKFFGHFDLPPGSYSVRVLVRNARTGAHALRAVDVEVPTFAGGPALLPPLFPEPAGSWLIAREAQQPDDRQVAYPFLLPGALHPGVAAGAAGGPGRASCRWSPTTWGRARCGARSRCSAPTARRWAAAPLTLVDRSAAGPPALTG